MSIEPLYTAEFSLLYADPGSDQQRRFLQPFYGISALPDSAEATEASDLVLYPSMFSEDVGPQPVFGGVMILPESSQQQQQQQHCKGEVCTKQRARGAAISSSSSSSNDNDNDNNADEDGGCAAAIPSIPIMFDSEGKPLVAYVARDEAPGAGERSRHAGTADTLLKAARTPYSAPSPRSGHLLLSCPERKSLLLYGGLGEDTYNDVWEYDVVRGLWREHKQPETLKDGWKANPPLLPEPAYGQAGTMYHDAEGKPHMFVLGGVGWGDECNGFAHSFNPETSEWSNILLTIQIPPLWGSVAGTLYQRRHTPSKASAKPAFSSSSPTAATAAAAACKPREINHSVKEEEEEEVIVLFGGMEGNIGVIHDTFILHMDHPLTEEEVMADPDRFLHSIGYEEEELVKMSYAMAAEVLYERGWADVHSGGSDGDDGDSRRTRRRNLPQTQSASSLPPFRLRAVTMAPRASPLEAYSVTALRDTAELGEVGERIHFSSAKIVQWRHDHADMIESWKTASLRSMVGRYWVESLPNREYPHGRRRACATVYKKHFMFMFGGRDERYFFNDFWVFNCLTRRWLQIREEVPCFWMNKYFAEPLNPYVGEYIEREILGPLRDKCIKDAIAKATGSDRRFLLEPKYRHEAVHACPQNSTAQERTGTSMVIDPLRRCVYIYGGYLLENQKSLTFYDLHAYHVDTHKWRKVSVQRDRLWDPCIDGSKDVSELLSSCEEEALPRRHRGTRYVNSDPSVNPCVGVSTAQSLERPPIPPSSLSHPSFSLSPSSTSSEEQQPRQQQRRRLEHWQKMNKVLSVAHTALMNGQTVYPPPPCFARGVRRCLPAAAALREEEEGVVTPPSQSAAAAPALVPQGYARLPVLLPQARTMAAMAADPIFPGGRFFLFGGRVNNTAMGDLFDCRISPLTAAQHAFCQMRNEIRFKRKVGWQRQQQQQQQQWQQDVDEAYQYQRANQLDARARLDDPIVYHYHYLTSSSNSNSSGSCDADQVTLSGVGPAAAAIAAYRYSAMPGTREENRNGGPLRNQLIKELCSMLDLATKRQSVTQSHCHLSVDVPRNTTVGPRGRGRGRQPRGRQPQQQQRQQSQLSPSYGSQHSPRSPPPPYAQSLQPLPAINMNGNEGEGIPENMGINDTTNSSSRTHPHAKKLAALETVKIDQAQKMRELLMKRLAYRPLDPLLIAAQRSIELLNHTLEVSVNNEEVWASMPRVRSAAAPTATAPLADNRRGDWPTTTAAPTSYVQTFNNLRCDPKLSEGHCLLNILFDMIPLKDGAHDVSVFEPLE